MMSPIMSALESAGARSSESHVINGVDHSNNPITDEMHQISHGNSNDQNSLHGKNTHHVQHQQHHLLGKSTNQINGNNQNIQMRHENHNDDVDNFHLVSYEKGESENSGEGFKRDMRDLEDLLSKLNPMAEEFVPPSLVNGNNSFGYANSNAMHNDSGNGTGQMIRRRRNNYIQGRRMMNSRTSMAQREDVIRKTVYVCDIDQQVTEEQLAHLFLSCGQVVDCRVCGDPNSVLRFAFVEFTNEDGARAALSLSGTILGFYPLRVLVSKTAIAPVNPTFLPRSEDERKMCARTIYCTNIDKKASQADVKLFFESFCGKVYRLRMLGDYQHSTRIAFVEFVMAESAIAALNCSGAILGSLPLRISPSKTPVRPSSPRSSHN